MMLRSLLLALTLLFAPLPAAQADGPVLIELFASKNCRNCPKAHKTLQTVQAEQKNVLILTWSVSYWDYLGGKDKMALPASSERQRLYAERFGQRGPYTPQTVYDGAAQCAGNKPDHVAARLKDARAAADSGVTLKLREAGIELTGKTSALADIWLVDFLSGADNQTDMVNPVTKVTALSPWLGGRTVLKTPTCASGCAIIVQEAGFGKVLAALDVTP
jgi:hypothetical protein